MTVEQLAGSKVLLLENLLSTGATAFGDDVDDDADIEDDDDDEDDEDDDVNDADEEDEEDDDDDNEDDDVNDADEEDDDDDNEDDDVNDADAEDDDDDDAFGDDDDADEEDDDGEEDDDVNKSVSLPSDFTVPLRDPIEGADEVSKSVVSVCLFRTADDIGSDSSLESVVDEGLKGNGDEQECEFLTYCHVSCPVVFCQPDQDAPGGPYRLVLSLRRFYF